MFSDPHSPSLVPQSRLSPLKRTCHQSFGKGAPVVNPLTLKSLTALLLIFAKMNSWPSSLLPSSLLLITPFNLAFPNNFPSVLKDRSWKVNVEGQGSCPAIHTEAGYGRNPWSISLYIYIHMYTIFWGWVPELFTLAVDTNQHDLRVKCSKLYFILVFRHTSVDIKEDENLPPSKQIQSSFPWKPKWMLA